jgi:hypothetical protein
MLVKELSRKFLSILFTEGEEVCLSPNKYAHKSFPWENIGPEMTVETQGKNSEFITISEDDVLLVAINPIKGEKNDANVTALRTFLMELDDGDVYEQKQYIDELKMPYSVCVFSGNKSLHYGITLNLDLPSLIIWQDINQWILNIVKRADQQNKNPTKSIRFPGNKRKDGKGLVQAVVDIRERVDYWALVEWLNKYPNLNPMYERQYKEVEKRVKEAENRIRRLKAQDGDDNLASIIPSNVLEFLTHDIIGTKFGGRNADWHWACRRLAEAGMDEDLIEYIVAPHFTEESDFTEREWKNIIKSAVKHTR